MSSNEEFVPVICDETEKFLTRIAEDGIKIWCKECHIFHTLYYEKITQTLKDIKSGKVLVHLRV